MFTWICSELNLGHIGASYSSLFLSKSLKNSGKYSVVVWKICPREFPRVIRLSLGAAPLGKVWWPSRIPKGQIFPDSHCGLSTVYTKLKRVSSKSLESGNPPPLPLTDLVQHFSNNTDICGFEVRISECSVRIIWVVLLGVTALAPNQTSKPRKSLSHTFHPTLSLSFPCLIVRKQFYFFNLLFQTGWGWMDSRARGSTRRIRWGSPRSSGTKSGNWIPHSETSIPPSPPGDHECDFHPEHQAGGVQDQGPQGQLQQASQGEEALGKQVKIGFL